MERNCLPRYLECFFFGFVLILPCEVIVYQLRKCTASPPNVAYGVGAATSYQCCK